MSKANNNNQVAIAGLALAAAASLALYFYFNNEEEKVAIEGKAKKLEDDVPVSVPSSSTDRSLDVDSNLTPKTSNASPVKPKKKKLDDDDRLEEKKLHAKIEELDKTGKAFFKEKKVSMRFGAGLSKSLWIGAFQYWLIHVCFSATRSTWRRRKHSRKRYHLLNHRSTIATQHPRRH